MQRSGTIPWDSLYNELFSFVNLKVRDRSVTADIIQEVFIKVHTKSHQIKETEKITGWIYRITRNAVADHFRIRSKTIAPVNIHWESDHQEFNDCVAHCLKVLMTTLPEKYRLPLELAEIENVTQYELAERLNISYSAARTRVQRARKLLKAKLDDLYVIKTDSYGNVISCEDRGACCCRRG
jgi:RNA polymerase sigma-70 factor, ECF subfamily